MKKRILIALGVLVLAAGIGAGGWYYYTHHAGSAGGSDIVYVTKDKQAFGNGFRSGKPICRCCGTAGNGSGKDRKRPKGKRSSGKDRSGSQEGQLLFQYDLGSIQQSLQEAQLALDRLKNEQLSISDQITTLEAEKKESYSR